MQQRCFLNKNKVQMQVIQQWCITEQKPQIKKNTTAVFHKTKTDKCKDTLAVTHKKTHTNTIIQERFFMKQNHGMQLKVMQQKCLIEKNTVILLCFNYMFTFLRISPLPHFSPHQTAPASSLLARNPRPADVACTVARTAIQEH